MKEDSCTSKRFVNLENKNNCDFKNGGCVLERKSMAAYSAMAVFHSKSEKGSGEEGRGFSRNKSDGMDLECDVST